MIDLRNILGLRSPIHSLARILNPLGARCGLQSIFHPGYQAVHGKPANCWGPRHRHQGEGGEIEVNPDAACHLFGTEGGDAWDEEWPALSPLRHVKPERIEAAQLLGVWDGSIDDAYARLAILGTMALALRGLGHPREAAFSEAERLWKERNASN